MDINDKGSGFYDDDGVKINPTLMPKPSLCVSCKKDDLSDEEEIYHFHNQLLYCEKTDVNYIRVPKSLVKIKNSLFMTRTEKDLLGERELPAEALYGIHTLRAIENFPLSGRIVSPDLIRAFGYVKLACAKTNSDLGYFQNAAKLAAVEKACEDMISGELYEHVKVDALQGGAGTSTNMNVNEVLANRALQLLGASPGEYDKIDPLDDLNMHQSTNDTYPTALKVAMVFKLRDLEKSLVGLLESFQRKEKEFAHVVKVGRTQMQDAVLTTLGRSMSSYAEAIGRDRWRVFKCEERLRVVNLGGTAIGTGITAPRQYIFKATENLKKLTGLGLARAENLVEATQNNDVFVEVAGILSACASNLLKIATDLRFLSSGPDAGIGELRLPARQAGSSLMPGKVNPVIPEAVTQAAIVATSNNAAISQAVGMGSLELNPFMPLIADKSLETLSLLANASAIFAELCVDGLSANEEMCATHVGSSTAVVTALMGAVGYEKAQEVATESSETGKSVKNIAVEKGLISAEEFDALVAPEAVNRLGSPKVTQAPRLNSPGVSHESSTSVPLVSPGRPARKVTQASRLNPQSVSSNNSNILKNKFNNRDGRSTLGSDKRDACVTFDYGRPLIVTERNLPHWQQPGTTYFITFRLTDSIPAETVMKIKKDREDWLKQHQGPMSQEDWREYNRLFSETIQNLLDAGVGSCLLKDRKISNIVEDAITHFDGERYKLGQWVVMPNHAHVLVTPFDGHDLQDITHSWKSFSAHEINKLLKKEGDVWRHESYDHIIRNEKQLRAIEQYILDNPKKARLTKGFQVSN